MSQPDEATANSDNEGANEPTADKDPMIFSQQAVEFSTDKFNTKYTRGRTIATFEHGHGGVMRATINKSGPSTPAVAVKYYTNEPGNNWSAILNWEAKGMEICHGHKNIVAHKEVVHTDDASYLVMDLCDSDLYAATENCPDIPLECTQKLFKQMVCGVQYCHRNGIAHRDIKYENFFVKYQNGATAADLANPATVDHCQVLLGDFGFWCYSRDTRGGLVMCKTTCGSDVYAAPEQLLKGVHAPGGYNPEAADVFSLGVCLFYLYFGFPPWETNIRNSDPYSMLWYKGEATQFWTIIDYHTQNKASSAFKSLFSSMCNIDPAERPALAQVLAHPFMKSGDHPSAEYKAPAVPKNGALATLILSCMSGSVEL